MRLPVFAKRHPEPALGASGPIVAGRRRSYSRQVLWRVRAILVMALGLSLAQLIPALTSTVSAASPLNIFVGYFDTHTVPFTLEPAEPVAL